MHDCNCRRAAYFFNHVIALRVCVGCFTYYVLAALPSTGVAVTFSRYNYDLIGGTTFLRNNLRLLLHTLTERERERETFLLDKKEKVSFAEQRKSLLCASMWSRLPAACVVFVFPRASTQRVALIKVPLFFLRSHPTQRFLASAAASRLMHQLGLLPIMISRSERILTSGVRHF